MLFFCFFCVSYVKPTGYFLVGINFSVKGEMFMYECMEEWFEWEYKGRIIKLFIDDIYYICSEKRKTYIHAKNGIYQIGTSVKQEREKMGERPFVLTHNAYLVHLKHLECIGPQEAVLRNGDRVPVSERREQRAKQEIRKYIEQMKLQKKGVK